MKLQNKITVITGTGKGIGRAVAELFLKEGAMLVLNSRTKADLDSFKKEHAEQSEKITCIPGDITKESTINRIIKETIKKHKRIDILINNAGFGIFKDMVKTTNKEFDDLFNVNVRALYLITRGILPYMINQKEGTIINIASLSGKQGFATGTIYCAAKHAVMGLTRALFLEVRKYNIRVTAICPGSVDTDFFNRESHTTSNLKKETMLTPGNIAESCLYAAVLPQNAVVSELEIRPANPKY